MILDLSTDHNRGHFMGTYNGLYRTWSLVGMLAGGFCVDLFGMRSVTTVFGVAAFITLPIVLLFVPNSKNRTSLEEQGVKKWLVLKEPRLLWILTSVFLVVMCLEGMFTTSLSHLIEVHPNSKISLDGIVIGAASLAGVLQAIRWALGPVLSPWFGRLSDGRRGRKPFIVGSLIASSIFMAFVNSNLPLGIWLLNLLAILLVSSVLSTVMDAFASDVATGSLKKVIMTVYVIVMDVGASFGPVFGYLSERLLGLPTTFLVSAAILFFLAIKWAFSRYEFVKNANNITG
jgi:predicted MFS family arabinose efflux permease